MLTKTPPDAEVCFACGGRLGPWINDARDYLTEDHFQVRRCQVCKLGVTQPSPSSLDRYYPEEYRRYSSTIGTILKRLYRWRIDRWSSHLPPQGRALELGCGQGWMLRELADRGWDVLGTERSWTAASAAANESGITTIVADPSALSDEAGFDLILLHQAMEHLDNPPAILAECSRLLKKGGTLIVSVPNAGSWQARWFRDAWFHLDVPRHLFHFTRRSVSEAFNTAGLQVTRVDDVFPEHDVFGWVQSALNKAGIEQNKFTKALIGSSHQRRRVPLAQALIFGLMSIIALPATLLSWAAGSGAIIEVWGRKQ